MRLFVAPLALALAVAPLAVAAQSDSNGPSPEMRATMMRARADAKTASYAALSPDHRSRVQAIVDKFDAGTITSPRDAATQIDAILSADEAKSVLAQRQAMRDAMRASFANGAGNAAGGPNAAGPNAGGPGPGAGGPGGAMNGRDGGRGGNGASPDAGRFLLTVGADPEKLRDAMRAERERASQ